LDVFFVGAVAGDEGITAGRDGEVERGAARAVGAEEEEAFFCGKTVGGFGEG